MVNGSSMIVNVLPPEILLKEKIDSYLARKKVRDFYDIFFLLKFVEKKRKTKAILINFLKKYPLPKDVKDLKTLIISGAVPKQEDTLQEIKKWVR